MRVLCLLLCLTLSLPALAQEASAPTLDRAQVESATLLLPEGRKAEVTGGWWVSSGVMVATGEELEARRTKEVLLVAGIVLTTCAAAVALGYAWAQYQRAESAEARTYGVSRQPLATGVRF